MKIGLWMIIGLALVPLITPNIIAMCAAEGMEWWEPCNDTGPYSDGFYIKYSILVPIIFVAILVSGIVLIIYWRKRK
jgi:hypothetical protein